MKKNKTMAYAVAATLLVGGTFVGTKALFTDNVDVAGELAISTGDLNIEVASTENKWHLNRNGNESENSDGTQNVEVNNADKETENDDTGYDITENTVFANNLKPGDTLSKEITVKNEGTLLAKVTLGNTFDDNTLGVLKDLVNPSQTVLLDLDGDGNYGEDEVPGEKITKFENILFTLATGEEAKIKLELNVRLDKEVEDNHNDGTGFNNDSVEGAIINLNNKWTLKAQQQNLK